MKRRDAVERITLILGGALSPELSAGLMGQVLNKGASVEVSDAQATLLSELADVIIPDTDTPGAKAAGVEQFIIRVMRDCYELEEQENFYAGLAKMDAACQEAHGRAFVELELPAKNEMVEKTMKSDSGFFRQMKSLTVTGYFTSEIGATQALAYMPIPGDFRGDVPMEPGQKAWATK